MSRWSRVGTVGLWIASIALAALFLATGIPKLLGAEGWGRHFLRWGYPDWLRLVVGATEVVSAALLLVPRFARLGAGAIAVVMAGATYTHLARASGEAGRAVFTVVLLLLAAGIVRWRRRSS